MAPLSILDELDLVARSHQIPYHVLLELTYACNLRCVMCYNPMHHAVDELSLEEYIDLFDQLVRLGTVQLTLTGGEVLVHPHFWEIAQAARDRHFALRIFTNGTRVTPEIAGRLADLVPIAVEVSLYGATAETHDAVTAKAGSFVQTIEGIRNLRDAGAPVVVKTLLTQINKHEIAEVCDLVDDLNVIFRGFDSVVFATHSGDTTPLSIRIPGEEVARLLPADLEAKEDLVCGDGEPMCGAAHDFVSITPHGLVYPCLSMRIPMGNIRERAFEEIWRAPHEQVDEVRAATWDTLSTCSGCEGRGACQRCPGLAWHEDGDYLGPSTTHCDITLSRVELAKKPSARV
jgi:radical SAM protein with 4Fe4S-binding SPASM domain